MTEDSAADAIRSMILALRDDAVLRVAGDGPLTMVEAERLKARIARILSDPALVASLEENLTDYGLWSFNRGVAVIDDLIAGVELPDALGLPPANTAIAASYLAGAGVEAIKSIPEALLGRVRRTVTLAFVGQRTPGEVAAALQRDFDISARRAETITRTEVKRLSNAGTQARIAEVAPKIKAAGIAMEKRWKHSSGSSEEAGLGIPGARTRKGFQRAKVRQNYIPRPHHKALHNTAVEPEGLFHMVDDRGMAWDITGPYDPILPAREIVNCHCIVSMRIKREKTTL